jgi:hypothetical protein
MSGTKKKKDASAAPQAKASALPRGPTSGCACWVIAVGSEVTA